MGAVDELGSRGLTHWSRAVSTGICFATTPRSPERSALMAGRLTLKRDAGGVLVVQRAARSGWALPPWPRQRPPRGTSLGVPFTRRFAVHGMITCVRVRDELRDNHHVSRRTSVDPEGCLNRSNPRKCAGQRGAFLASGRRGRGFESRHPDTLYYQVRSPHRWAPHLLPRPDRLYSCEAHGASPIEARTQPLERLPSRNSAERSPCTSRAEAPC